MVRIFLLLLFLSAELLTAKTLPTSIYPSQKMASEAAARKIAHCIISKKGEKTVIGLATGGTMIEVYAALKRILLEEEIDLSNVITFNLDEYLNLPLSHPESYHSFMYTHLFNDLLYSQENPKGIRKENIHIPSFDIWQDYEELIDQLGPIDLQLLGIGRNGHIGFSEPGTPFDSRTHLVELSKTTIKDNARFFQGDLANVPKRAVTMGIATILDAKEILLLAFGHTKADAIYHTLYTQPNPCIPATALQIHPHAHLILDEAAASALSDPTIRCFRHARLLRERTISEEDLWIANGQVIEPQKNADEYIEMHGKLIAPGFIDLQINGGFGCDFSTQPEKVEEVAKKLLPYGTTSFLPTVITSSQEQYHSVLPQLQPRKLNNQGAEILGIHLEGPFCSPYYRGAHNLSLIQEQASSATSLYGNLEGVKIVTLAPEINGGLNLIHELKKQNIVVSVGHSNADSQKMKEALGAGINLITHLFNAMKPYHHRDPAIIGCALSQQKMFYSLIVDGHHLDDECVRLCWRCNPEGLILISDAMQALGCLDGMHKLGSQWIDLIGNAPYVKDTNTIAGSILPLNQAVKNLKRITQCRSEEALNAASLKPSQLLRLYPKKGALKIGSDADFVVLSDELEIEATYIQGELAWQKNSL